MSATEFDTVDGAPILGLNAPKVFLNKKNIAVRTDKVQDHTGHFHVDLPNGSDNVFANNLKVNRKTDLASCDHPIETGSHNVFSNELPVARVGEYDPNIVAILPVFDA